MRTKTTLLCLVLARGLIACLPSGEPRPPVDKEQSVPGDAPPHGPTTKLTIPMKSADPRDLAGLLGEGSTVAAASTAEGEWALFDVQTGALLSTSPSADLGGERDLAFDPWQSRLLVFEADAEGTWGEVAAYPVEEEGESKVIGDRQHRVWIDGRARIAASPEGAVVFEESAGPRWRLVRDDSAPTPSVFGPRPMSLVTAPLEDGSLRLTALTYGAEDSTLDLRVAEVDPSGVQPLVTVPVVVEPLSSPPAARWITAGGAGRLLDVASGDVWVTPLAGSGWPAWMPVGIGPGVTSVTAAAPFPGEERVAVSLTGGFDLAVIGLGPGGAPECAAAIDLPGEMKSAPLFFERPLLPVSEDRVLAATSAGVFAVTVSADCPPVLEIDPNFEGEGLRGPLAQIQ